MSVVSPAWFCILFMVGVFRKLCDNNVQNRIATCLHVNDVVSGGKYLLTFGFYDICHRLYVYFRIIRCNGEAGHGRFAQSAEPLQAGRCVKTSEKVPHLNQALKLLVESQNYLSALLHLEAFIKDRNQKR